MTIICHMFVIKISKACQARLRKKVYGRRYEREIYMNRSEFLPESRYNFEQPPQEGHVILGINQEGEETVLYGNGRVKAITFMDPTHGQTIYPIDETVRTISFLNNMLTVTTVDKSNRLESYQGFVHNIGFIAEQVFDEVHLRWGDQQSILLLRESLFHNPKNTPMQ